MTSQYRERLGEILTDYRDGLLDSLEDAVDAIVDVARAYDAGRIDVTTMADAEPQFIEVAPGHRPPEGKDPRND